MRALIFDFDDTLIVSRLDRAARLLEAISSFGHKVDQTKLATVWGRPFREMLLHLCPALEPHFERFLWHYADYLRVLSPTSCPGVSEAIPILSESAHLFVHTASHSLLARTDLHTLGLLRYFDFVCGSDWQSSPKPAPDSLSFLTSLLEEAGYSKRDILYVGDSVSDNVIARTAGVEFIGVHFSKTVFSELTEPPRVISDMQELIAVSREMGDSSNHAEASK